MQVNKTEAIDELSTIQDFLRWTASALVKYQVALGHGTDNAWDEAVSLILPLLHLPMDSDPQIISARLTCSEREHLANTVQRRIEARIPTSYLTNKAWFGGLEFFVDERVLVPRSPFAEFLQAGLPNWFDENGPSSILELCTGSGCIAILAALTYPDARVDALDISRDALAVAEKNRESYHLTKDLGLIESDLFAEVGDECYELIISNPPYVGAKELENLPEEYHHEPVLGLAAGEEGLDIVIRILQEADQFLTDEGLLVVEVGNSDQALQAAFPSVPFLWLEFEEGGHGVFMLTATQLKEFKPFFMDTQTAGCCS